MVVLGWLAYRAMCLPVLYVGPMGSPIACEIDGKPAPIADCQAGKYEVVYVSTAWEKP